MVLTTMPFSSCLLRIENTVTCAYAIDTSINGQGVCVRVCIAGEGGESAMRNNKLLHAVIFG